LRLCLWHLQRPYGRLGRGVGTSRARCGSRVVGPRAAGPGVQPSHYVCRLAEGRSLLRRPRKLLPLLSARAVAVRDARARLPAVRVDDPGLQGSAVRILLTGGTGLIGSHALPALSERHDVVALTRRAPPAELADLADWIVA